jgi:hypothetical protein
VRGRSFIGPAGDLDGEAPVAEWGDDQPTARVGGIRLGMARRTERHRAVEIEVRAPLRPSGHRPPLEGEPLVVDFEIAEEIERLWAEPGGGS